ncbi:MAG: PilZ domain-containing protein [Planctomycetaceae bacterium]|nr:PilZ domain-containing protein [Planctomycetaceae bacterium]
MICSESLTELIMDQPSEKMNKTAIEVLDMLDRWSDKMAGHHTQKRQYHRVTYRTMMTVYQPYADQMAGESQESTGFTVWSRNISRGGIGFIYTGQLPLGKYLMCLDPEQAGKLWFLVDIVRTRKVHDKFWEYGAKLLERASI